MCAWYVDVQRRQGQCLLSCQLLLNVVLLVLPLVLQGNAV